MVQVMVQQALPYRRKTSMRAKEFINEGIRGREGSLIDDVASALPATFAIPSLQNQDPYLQYRFGIALAKAKGSSTHDIPPFEAESAWGENAIIVAYDPESEKMIDQALKDVGAGSKRLISTPKSEEGKTVQTVSPVARPKKNRYGI